MSLEGSATARETTVMDTLQRMAEKTGDLGAQIEKLHSALSISPAPPICDATEKEPSGDLATEFGRILQRQISVLESLHVKVTDCVHVVLRLKPSGELKS